MAPTRPAHRKGVNRGREPREESVSRSNRARILRSRGFSALRTSPSSPLSNVRRFHQEYLLRPRPRRTVSEPPSPKFPTRRHRFTNVAQPHAAGLHSTITSTFNRIKGKFAAGIHKAWQGCHAAVVRLRDCVNQLQPYIPHRRTLILVGIVVCAGGYLGTNSLAYNWQSDPPALARYAAPPNWMHTTSLDQILGLPEPILPLALQPRPVVAHAFKLQQRDWSIDKGAKHRDAGNRPLPSHTMAKIFRRIFEAKEHYHDQLPYGNKTKEEVLESLHFESDGLPRFRLHCKCSLTNALYNQVAAALTPYPMHTPLPATDEQLKDYCPCTVSSAVKRLRDVYDPGCLPPKLNKFASETSLPASIRNDIRARRLWKSRHGRDMDDYTPQQAQRWIELGWINVEEAHILAAFDADALPNSARRCPPRTNSVTGIKFDDQKVEASWIKDEGQEAGDENSPKMLSAEDFDDGIDDDLYEHILEHGF